MAYDWIKDFCPDVIFSLYFRDILPQAILDIPRMGAVNLHPALLPKYRGTFSVPWAIINGEEYTGFSYHYMLAQVDLGNIILQRRVCIRSDDTAYSLYHRLITEGLGSFEEAFRLVTEDHYAGKPQVGESSYFSRKVPFGGYIDFRWTREQIDRFIRAMYFPPFRGALVQLDDGTDLEVTSIQQYDALVIQQRIYLT
jgi:methionyl-tRNA formyltransferase